MCHRTIVKKAAPSTTQEPTFINSPPSPTTMPAQKNTPQDMIKAIAKATGEKAVSEKTASKNPEGPAKTVTIEERYTVEREKHKLPEYQTLQKEFDIEGIEADTPRITKEVAKKVFEHIDIVRKTVEGLLQPDASILLMQEAETLAESDHEMIADLARRLMRLDRRMLRAELTNTDEEYAEFIRQAATEWPEMKQEILPIVERMERGWLNKRKGKQRQHYLG